MTLSEMALQLEAERVAGGALLVFFLLLSLVQISPIKINPWDTILKWLGKKLNGGVEDHMDCLQKQVRDLWINSHRHSILTFARECRSGVVHDSDEWYNILNICEEYSTFCAEYSVQNGIVRENTRYIRELFQQLAREHRL